MTRDVNQYEIDITLIPKEMAKEEISEIQAGFRDMGGFVEQFQVIGISNPYLIDAQTNL